MKNFLSLVCFSVLFTGTVLAQTQYNSSSYHQFNTTNYGYCRMGTGPIAEYYFNTDKSYYRFDKPVYSTNGFLSYNSTLNLEAASSYYVQIQPRSSSYGLILREYNSSDYGNFEVTSSGLGFGYNTSSYHMLINTSGNVGVGCDPEGATFKVYGSSNPSIQLGSPSSRLEIIASTCGWCGAHDAKNGDIVFRPMGGVDNHHGMIFYLPNDNNDGNSYIKFGDDANNLWMGIFNNKTVRIDGKLYAKEMRCRTNVWSDFVFNSDYNLRSLDEVESFINENNHLPDVPNEKTVMEEGIDVGKMNAILLQKIEELTLYIIDQQKQINELSSKINQ